MSLIHIDTTSIIVRLLLAALLGGIIGWERELRNKQAGFKTHLLVSVGSTLIMLTSIYGFGDLLDHPNARFDPARLAAQVVSGIGFLGAGAIMRRSNHVSGLTTAAMLWVVAGIGLSVGAGFYVPAVVTTLIVVICTVLLRKVEKKYATTSRYGTMHFTVRDDVLRLEDLKTILEKEKFELYNVSVTDDEDPELQQKKMAIEFRIRLKSSLDILQVMEGLRSLTGVKEMKFDWKG